MTGDDRAATVAEALLSDTDLLTPNHDGTPEWYTVEAENVPDLVRHILALDAQPGDTGQAGGLGDWHPDHPDRQAARDARDERHRAARAAAAPTPSHNQTCPGPHDHMARCWNAGAAARAES